LVSVHAGNLWSVSWWSVPTEHTQQQGTAERSYGWTSRALLHDL
jgi:hypothetical protein